MAKIKVKALKYGTINGHDGSILHFNPKGSDPRAREPLIDEEDLERVEREGLAKRAGDAAGAKLASVEVETAKVSVAASADAAPAGSETASEHAPGGDGDGLSEQDPDAPPAARKAKTVSKAG